MKYAAQIDSLLPHRPPFRFVDELVEVSGERGEFCLCLAADDPRLLEGAMSPVLLVEALAQSAAAYQHSRITGESHRGLLASIDSARFFGAARGGERVQLLIRRDRSYGAFVRFSGTATQGPRPLAEAEFTVCYLSDTAVTDA